MSIDVAEITNALDKCDSSSLTGHDIETEAGTAFIAGYRCETGQGSDDAAAEWYRRAAEANFPPAQVNLGWMHANGKGVELDLQLAYMWFYISFEHQVPEKKRYEGKTNCETMEQKKLLTSDEIEEAQSMAEECLEQNYRADGL